jgi:hypothetical protein
VLPEDSHMPKVQELHRGFSFSSISTMQRKRSTSSRASRRADGWRLPCSTPSGRRGFGGVVDRFGIPWGINCGEREVV